jgi:hypothetical protein
MKIFIVSEGDPQCLTKLMNHLDLTAIPYWHNTMLVGDSDWQRVIMEQFSNADVILYLVSTNSYNTYTFNLIPTVNQNCYNVIVSACMWEYMAEVNTNTCLHNPKTNFNKATDKDEFIVECITTLMDNYATQ